MEPESPPSDPPSEKGYRERRTRAAHCVRVVWEVTKAFPPDTSCGCALCPSSTAALIRRTNGAYVALAATAYYADADNCADSAQVGLKWKSL